MAPIARQDDPRPTRAKPLTDQDAPRLEIVAHDDPPVLRGSPTYEQWRRDLAQARKTIRLYACGPMDQHAMRACVQWQARERALLDQQDMAELVRRAEQVRNWLPRRWWTRFSNTLTRTARKKGTQAAAEWLASLEAVVPERWRRRVGWGDDQMRQWADSQARYHTTASQRLTDLDSIRSYVLDTYASYGMPVPRVAEDDPTLAMHRLRNSRTMRAICREALRGCLHELGRRMGTIRRGHGNEEVTADQVVAGRIAQARINREIAERQVMRQEGGSISITMADIQRGSHTNPKNRLVEWRERTGSMARRCIDDEGKTAYFLTITAPAHVHPATTAGCREGTSRLNDAFDGTSTQETWREMAARWHRFTAFCSRKTKKRPAGIDVDFVLVSEPQHDGTPHIHGTLYVDEQWEATIWGRLQHYFLSTWHPDERGAEEHRLDLQRVKNQNPGAVINYLAPYVGKSLGIEEGGGSREGDEGDNKQEEREPDPNSYAVRTDAWRAACRIPAFSFSREPASITAYRTMRSGTRAIDQCPPEMLWAAMAAQGGNHYAFTRLAVEVGGFGLLRETGETVLYTGEIRETTGRVAGLFLRGMEADEFDAGAGRWIVRTGKWRLQAAAPSTETIENTGLGETVADALTLPRGGAGAPPDAQRTQTDDCPGHAGHDEQDKDGHTEGETTKPWRDFQTHWQGFLDWHGFLAHWRMECDWQAFLAHWSRQCEGDGPPWRDGQDGDYTPGAAG